MVPSQFLIVMKGVLFKTESNNNYYYSYNSRISTIIHPNFADLIEGKSSNDVYYSNKFDYLKRHGFFNDKNDIKFGRLTASMVKESIRQTAQITFEITDFCNLNCAYCYFGKIYEDNDGRNQKNINVDLAKKLIDYLFENKPKNKFKKVIIGFYGGEPLLNIEAITTLVCYINNISKYKGISVEYTMTTNATLLSKNIDFLVENKFNLLVSIDGDKLGDSYRVFKSNNKNSFDNVVENIDYVYYNYPKYFREHVKFNSVLHNHNSINSIFVFLYGRYKKIPRVAQLTSDGILKSEENRFKNMFNSIVKSEIEFKEKSPELYKLSYSEMTSYKEVSAFLKYDTMNFYVSNIIFLSHKNELYFPTSTCIPGQKKIYFTTHGKILPCEKINYRFYIGSVSDKVYLDYLDIADRYNGYYNKLEKMCQKCYLHRFCDTCMFHMSGIKDSFKSGVCEYFFDLNKYSNKLKRIYSFLERNSNVFSKIIEDDILL